MISWNLGWIFGFFNGEFLLRASANGGGVILLRTVWASFWIFLLSLALFDFSAKDANFAFSSAQFWLLFHEKFEWLGAIFVAIYIALYSRFSEQWAYLAGLYNSIAQCKVEAAASPDFSSPATEPWARQLGLSSQQARFAIWDAAFLADAFTLHLARKALFFECVHQLLQKREVRAAFEDAGEKNVGLAREFLGWYGKKQ